MFSQPRTRRATTRAMLGLTAAAAMLVTAACGSSDTGNDGPDHSGATGSGAQDGNGSAGSSGSGPSFTFTAATVNPRDQHLSQTLAAVGDKVDELSDGRLTFDVHYDGTLGDAPALYQSVASGDIDVVYLDADTFQQAHDDFELLGANYLFDSPEQYVEKINDPETFQHFEEELQEAPGVTVLAYAGGIERDILTTFPVNSIDDLDGKVIRSKDSEAELSWWKLLGANPVPVAFSELYTALQTGTVEGTQNSPGSMYLERFGEVAKYLARTQHTYTLGMIVVNNDSLDSLPDDVQDALIKAGEEIQPEYIQKGLDLNDEDVSKLEDEFDVEVTHPDLDPFIERSRQQLDQMADRLDAQDLIAHITE